MPIRNHDDLDGLRSRAEVAAQRAGANTFEPAEPAAALYELQVHQIELAMQNEELLARRDQLIRARDDYRDLYDQAPVGYLTLDQRGVCLRANDTAAAILGTPKAELVSRPLPALLDRSEADLLGRHLYAVFADAAPRTVELRLDRATGDTRQLRCDSVVRQANGQALCRTIVTDVTERNRMVEQLRRLNHGLEAQVAERTAALTTTNEELRRELAERERIEGELASARRLEALGRLAGGVAHDFNNLMTVIHLELDLLRARVSGDPDLERGTNAVHRAAKRASAVTAKLLAFAGREPSRPESLEMGRVVGEMASMLARLLPEAVSLRVTSSASPCWVSADPDGVERVLVNLVVNAGESIRGAGRVAVVVDPVTIDEERARRVAGARPGRFVSLAVRDDGCGMTHEQCTHIFEPFYTTKPAERGGGLGLATVYGMVSAAGGFIEVESEPGVGSMFRVFVPAIDAPPALPRANDAGEPPLTRGTETILLVDDQPEVRRAVARTLQDGGYRVVEAGSSSEGLAALAAHPRVQMVVTDVVMPGESGIEMAREIRRQRPDMPILLLSGYSDEADDQQDLPLLSKPVRADALFRAIRAALDA